MIFLFGLWSELRRFNQHHRFKLSRDKRDGLIRQIGFSVCDFTAKQNDSQCTCRIPMKKKEKESGIAIYQACRSVL